jgi:hypothetical protein
MKIIKNSKKGMEIVQVAILIAIAIALGIVFKDQIVDFELIYISLSLS